MVVIVSDTPLPPRERAPHYAPLSPWPLDLFVYTRAEIERFRERPPPVLAEALQRGLRL